MKTIHFDRMDTIKEKIIEASMPGVKYKPVFDSNDIFREWWKLEFGVFGKNARKKALEAERKKEAGSK
ncbi:MAG: hypothetical protein EBZ61_06665 [Micrococcales bacterium]|nr:hypothetical protein [Micrococcales bacterium]